MTTRPGASTRLAEMRQRIQRPAETPTIEPELKTGKFNVVRWFDAIRADYERVYEAASYWQQAVEDGTQYVVPRGNLEELTLQQPGLKFFYGGIHIDVQQARRWWEERLERMEAEKHNYYMFDPEGKQVHGAVKTTEAAKLAKADPEIRKISDIVRLLAYHEHNVERLIKALESIDYVLNNVKELRINKQEEVWVDPTRETRNE